MRRHSWRRRIEIESSSGFRSDLIMAACNAESGDESMSDYSDTDTDCHSDSQSGSDSDQGPATSTQVCVCGWSKVTSFRGLRIHQGKKKCLDKVVQQNCHSAEVQQQKACQYYNEGHCRYGKKCRNLHVCKYFLKGSCRYGASCDLQHIQGSDRSSRQDDPGRRSQGKKKQSYRGRSSSSSSDDFSDKPYKWQLDLGNGWEDVAHDYILEAQYSRPNTKGIQIYNTPCGALSIDFTKMRILKKTNLRVRRKGSRQTEWLWHYRSNAGWYQYGKKDSKGNASSIKSSSLEKEFQKNQRGTFQFTIDSTTYEIQFKDMCQKNLSTGHKRRIRRRPKYESPHSGGINAVTNAFKKLTTSSPKKAPLWQFAGKSGRWHSFIPRSACSICSADIEAEYQRNPQGSINFTVNGDSYTIDFKKMIQTNLKTCATRKVQRVE